MLLHTGKAMSPSRVHPAFTGVAFVYIVALLS